MWRVFIKRLFQGMVYLFAVVGFGFTGMFVAIHFHWTNVAGSVDRQSPLFERQATQAAVLGVATSTMDNASSVQRNIESVSGLDAAMRDLARKKQVKKENLCALKALKSVAPADAQRIWAAWGLQSSDSLIFKMLAAAKNSLPDAGALEAPREQCLASAEISDEAAFLGPWEAIGATKSVFAWSNDAEWGTLAQATVKDKEVIDRAAQVAGIEPRLIVSSLVVEQMRLFHSERELFKKFFEPLKILGNSTVISLGVMGIKPTTAEAIEQHLKDPNSPYYLGPEHEHDLDYPSGVDIGQERFNRLTDDKHRDYLYLYGALYLKQFLHQWEAAGQDIRYRPEILGTLFNVGFPQSHPNDHPQVGGSTIQVGDQGYSFGRLAYEFYYSGQLLNEFPYETK